MIELNIIAMIALMGMLLCRMRFSSAPTSGK